MTAHAAHAADALIYTVVFGAAARRGLSLAYYRVLARQLDADANADLDGADQRAARLPALRRRHAVGRLRPQRHRPGRVRRRRDPLLPGLRRRDAGELLVQSTALEPLGLQLHARRGAGRSAIGRSRSTSRPTTGASASSNSVHHAGARAAPICCRWACRSSGDGCALTRFARCCCGACRAALLVAIVAGRVAGGRSRSRRSSRLADAAREHRRHQPRAAAAGPRHRTTSSTTWRGAFNDTLGRLEHAVGEMRQFSAALAHELRTPLAALRGEIGAGAAARRDDRGTTAAALTSQLEEFDKLTRLIDQLLTLARAEAGRDSARPRPRRSRRARRVARRAARAGRGGAGDRAALRAVRGRSSS